MPAVDNFGNPIPGTKSVRDLVEIANNEKVETEKQAFALNSLNSLYDYTLPWKRNRRLIEDGLTFLGRTILPTTIATYLRDRNAASTKDLSPQFRKEMGIIPNIMTSMDYSAGEKDAMKKMSQNGKKGIIASDYPGYGRAKEDILSKILSPYKNVETTIGQSTPRSDGKVSDVYDFNVLSEQAQKDNKYYEDIAKKEGGIYATIRANAPYTNSTDAMDDRYKIKTLVDVNNGNVNPFKTNYTWIKPAYEKASEKADYYIKKAKKAEKEATKMYNKMYNKMYKMIR